MAGGALASRDRVAGAAIGPAVSGITLGMFRQTGFTRQNGINQAYNHAGNAVGAGLSGLLGWKFGLPAVFWLAVAFGVASIVAVLRIPAKAIDNSAARGLRDGIASDQAPRGFSVLMGCKPLLALAAALAMFHLGNGAMLPLYGLAVVATKQGNPAGFVAATIVVAQATMILASLIAMRMTVQGVGASLSPASGGWLAQWLGFGPAFLLLGTFAIGSLFIWTVFARIVKPACAVTLPPGSRLGNNTPRG